MNEQVNDLTNTERRLIEQAKTISPANFLESIKRQKGSFATFDARYIFKLLFSEKLLESRH